MIDDTPEIRELEDAVRDFDAVYAVKHQDGRFVRTSMGPVKRFSTREDAQSYIANRWASGYIVVRYS